MLYKIENTPHTLDAPLLLFKALAYLEIDREAHSHLFLPLVTPTEILKAFRNHLFNTNCLEFDRWRDMDDSLVKTYIEDQGIYLDLINRRACIELKIRIADLQEVRDLLKKYWFFVDNRLRVAELDPEVTATLVRQGKVLLHGQYSVGLGRPAKPWYALDCSIAPLLSAYDLTIAYHEPFESSTKKQLIFGSRFHRDSFVVNFVEGDRYVP